MSSKKYKCVVPYCDTTGSKGFSNFPSNPLEQEVWRRLCGLPYVKPRALVCHRHFSDSCFANGGVRRKLKKDSRPELNLPHVFLASTENVFGVEVSSIPEKQLITETKFLLLY